MCFSKVLVNLFCSGHYDPLAVLSQVEDPAPAPLADVLRVRAAAWTWLRKPLIEKI